MSTLKEEVRHKDVKPFYIGEENMWAFKKKFVLGGSNPKY